MTSLGKPIDKILYLSFIVKIATFNAHQIRHQFEML
jgi:hypothetical protein